MKKLLLGTLCALLFASCGVNEPSEGIYGTWKVEYKSINGRGSSRTAITFRKNGTYKTSSHTDGLGHYSSHGRFEFVGENEGVLYQYDRHEGGYVFESVVESYVVINGNKMTITTKGCEPTEYHR